MAQSCGTRTLVHLESEKCGSAAPEGSPLVNFQFFSSSSSVRCAQSPVERQKPNKAAK